MVLLSAFSHKGRFFLGIKMTESIRIKINGYAGLAELFKLANSGSENLIKDFPFTKSELLNSAKTIENTWKNWAMGYTLQDYPTLPIPACPKPDSQLAMSIKTEKTSATEYTIYSDHPQMEKYQNGEDVTIDMKAPDSPWLNGKKSRINKKDGSPYLIVPFSWKTKGVGFKNIVPQGIQDALRSRALTRTLPTTHPEPNARGEQIERNEYGSLEKGKFKSGWGGRISQEEAEASGDTRTAGMVRMWDSSYGINGNHGKYFTFRVISAKAAADKWIQHRHHNGMDITGALKKQYEELFYRNIAAAMQADWNNKFTM